MDRSAGQAVPDGDVPDALDNDNAADKADSGPEAPIRIAHIGGRYLVFDVADVARLRRQHNLCAVLVGITPQAPNQCLFSGLPLELTADEVRWLVCVRRAAVVVVDDRARHLTRLPLPDARRGLRAAADRQREAVAVTVAEEAAERARRGAEARAKREGKTGRRGAAREGPATAALRLRITPTTSDGLGGDDDDDRAAAVPASLWPGRPSPAAALRALLADRGYYTTPGLRFGGALSVYPGDPFRYHAHFVTMAPAAYARDAPVPLLDVVGTGRLATGVKKGLLLAGEVSSDDDAETVVRTFTLEWAAM